MEPTLSRASSYFRCCSFSVSDSRERSLHRCLYDELLQSFSSVGLRGFLFLQCRQLNLCIGQQWRDGVLRTTVSQHHCGTYGTVPTRVIEYTESDETTVATDVAEAGGSSGMSRLESQMTDVPDVRRDEAACETLDFRLPPREKI